MEPERYGLLNLSHKYELIALVTIRDHLGNLIKVITLGFLGFLIEKVHNWVVIAFLNVCFLVL